jgi:transposase
MGRPPTIRKEGQDRVSDLPKMSIAEAARKEKVSEQSIGRWKAEFIEAAGPRWWRVGRGRQAGRSSWSPRSWS